MSNKMAFEVPFLVGSVPLSEEGSPCASGFSCACGYSGCADNFDPDCGAGLAISAIGAIAGIVIAIVPTNAAPG